MRGARGEVCEWAAATMIGQIHSINGPEQRDEQPRPWRSLR